MIRIIPIIIASVALVGCISNPKKPIDIIENTKPTTAVFDAIISSVINAVDEKRQPVFQIPPFDEWGNPYVVVRDSHFIKIRSLGHDQIESEDDLLLSACWGDSFVHETHTIIDGDLFGEEGNDYDW